MRKPLQIISILLLTALISSCGGGLKMTSGWPGQEVAIDGSQDEWDGDLSYVEKNDLNLGFKNDDDFLYLTLATSDMQLQRQMKGLGFIVWFDPKGGEEKHFGIRFPVGMMGMGGGGFGGPGAGMPREEPDPEVLKERFESSLADIEILMSDKEQKVRMPVGKATGISVKISDGDGPLVYELKVPLQRTAEFPYAVQAQAGKAVGIGFQTAEIDREMLRERMRNGGFGGRPGRGDGGFGGGPFRGGRGMGRGGFERPEPLKLWTKVQLSSGNESAD